MTKIKLTDLPQDAQISEAEMKKVFGGVGDGWQGSSIPGINGRGLQLAVSIGKDQGTPMNGYCACNCDDGDRGGQECEECRPIDRVANVMDQVTNVANNPAMNVSIGAKLR